MWLSADEVGRLLHDPSHRIVDARAPERYQGVIEPLDPVAGHIPGASSHYFLENVTPEGIFRSTDELRARLSAVLGAVPPDRVLSYCGSGVSACHNLLALEQSGLRGGRLYAGSWSEWCSDPARPVETGVPGTST